MSITKKQIEKAIAEFCEQENKARTHKSVREDDPESLADSEFCDVGEEFNGLRFYVEDNNQGTEGGDDCHMVFRVTNGTDEQYIKFDGYYSSYDGSTYEDGFYFADFDLVQVKQWKKKGK